MSVADDVRSKVEELRAQLPPGVQLLVIHDISDFIKASVHSLIEHLILGSILASLIVWLFIRNWRAVIIAAVAIPASVIATFTLMRGMDFSLNNMTLLALTLAVGIVIDDAIIVLENIFRFMEEKGKDPFHAAIEATREIGLAVMATTLSLIIIFLPIAFMTGYARKYVNSFGWTMAMAILVSLLVAFTLTPMMSSRLLRLTAKRQDVAFGKISAGSGEPLSEHAALVARPSRRHCPDLPGVLFSPPLACTAWLAATGFRPTISLNFRVRSPFPRALRFRKRARWPPTLPAISRTCRK